MTFDWPTAFVFAVLIVSVFAFLAYRDRLATDQIKTAMRESSSWEYGDIEKVAAQEGETP